MKLIIFSLLVFMVLIFGVSAQEVGPDDPNFWTELLGTKGGLALLLVLAWRLLPAVAAIIPDGEKGALGFIRRLARVLGISPKDKE